MMEYVHSVKCHVRQSGLIWKYIIDEKTSSSVRIVENIFGDCQIEIDILEQYTFKKSV